MKTFYRITALLLLCGISFAQSNCTRKDDIATQNFNGFSKIIPNALVTVCGSTATGQPCTPPANIYSDNACSALVGSVTADINGNFHFYADPTNKYKYQISGSGVSTFEIGDVTLPLQSNSGVTLTKAISSSSYNNVVMEDTQIGTTVDARFGTAIGKNITATGGTSDARGEVQTGTLAAETDVGNSSFVPVSLVFPPKATWTYTGTDGTSCAFKFFSGSSAISPDDGGAPKFIIQGNASTNADSLICTDPSPAGGGSYIHLAGITAQNPASIGATYASGLFHFQKLFDNSVFERLKAVNSNGVGFQFDGGCCAGALINSTSDGAYGTNAVPCVFGVSNTAGPTAFNILNSSCDHPGAGKNNILVQGGFFTGKNRFSGITYMEPNTSDTTTPLIQIATNVRSVAFDSIIVGGGANPSTACVVDIATGVTAFNADQIITSFPSCGVFDHVHNLQLTGLGNNGSVPGYRFGSTPSYFMSGLNTTLLNIGTGSAGTFTNVASIDASGNVSGNKYTSTVATGTAPLVIASTTPVANLTLSQHPQVEYCGATSGGTQACAKTVLTTPFIVQGEVTLNTATTQSITTLPFTNANYSCSGSDLTTATGIVSFNTYANASVTIQESGGVNTDHLRYQCVGN